jgi:Ca-activated chloride channel family protein
MPLEVQSQRVEARIRDQIATTEVTQVFRNPTSRRFEGTFLFPLPAGAHVSEFSMEVNGKAVPAELLDAAKARRIYEDIVRQALDPALFEYAGRGLFKVRVFPIEPHATKEIRVRYVELLPRDGEIVRYTYPLDTSKYSLKPIPDFSLKVDVEAGADRVLQTVYSPSHEVEVARKGARHAVIGLEADRMETDEDFRLYLSHRREGGEPVALDFLTHHEAGADEPGHFLLLVSPSAWTEPAPPLPKDVVFVFDSSGSMRGEKMDQARAALAYCVSHLHPEDRFEVIRFSTEAEPVFGSLAPADAAHRERAQRFLDAVPAIGGTAIEEALVLAMRTAAEQARPGRPMQVIFLTDGKPTLGATEEEVILRSLQRAKGASEASIRVFCFGIGTSLNTHLLDRVAESTRAVSEYVLPEEDIEEKVSRFFAKISDPVLADLRLEIEGADWIRHRYPKDLPDLFRGDQLVVLGEYRRARNDGLVKLVGTLNGAERTFLLPVTLGTGKDHPFLAKLWATRRVGYLLDQIRLHGEREELKDEVVQLARRHRIVTPYTSFLIVEDEERRGVPMPMRTQLPSPESAPGPASPASGMISREYDAFRSKTEGADAVAAAQAAKALKETKDGAAVAAANRYADAARGSRLHLGVSRTVAGKTFYQNGEVWIDPEVQALPSAAPRRQVKFASAEYFDLLASRPELGPWLSVGPGVQVAVGPELIEILP